MADTCAIPGVAFDIAAAAGWYSAVAGLLAGFAFVAVLFPLDHDGPPEHDKASSKAVVVFASAFFSLLVLSLSYAVLSGRPAEGESLAVAAHEQILLGAAFGLSAMLLLVGLHAILATYGANRTVFGGSRRLVLTVAAVGGPIIVLAQTFSNAIDVERARSELGLAGTSCVASLPLSLWIGLGIVGGAVVAVLALYRARKRLPHRPDAQARVAVGVLVFTVALTAWTAVVTPLLPAQLVVGVAFQLVVVALTSVAAVVFAAATWSST